MKIKEEKTTLEKLREMWDNMPSGSKSLLYKDFGYSKQNVADVLKNGIQDKTTLLKLIEDIKSASATICKNIYALNQKVQSS